MLGIMIVEKTKGKTYNSRPSFVVSFNDQIFFFIVIYLSIAVRHSRRNEGYSIQRAMSPEAIMDHFPRCSSQSFDIRLAYSSNWAALSCSVSRQ